MLVHAYWIEIRHSRECSSTGPLEGVNMHGGLFYWFSMEIIAASAELNACVSKWCSLKSLYFIISRGVWIHLDIMWLKSNSHIVSLHSITCLTTLERLIAHLSDK